MGDDAFQIYLGLRRSGATMWSPTNGRHDFPDPTSAESEHQHIWEPYVPTRW